MAVDMFLKLDGSGFEGESVDDKHAKEIDVLSWSWGASQSGSLHVGGGGGSGKASFQDLNVVKWVDTSSPKLLEYCSNGEHIPNGWLVIRKAGTKPLEYMKYHFKDIIVTSVSTGGSGGEDRLTENLTLNFREFKYEYFKQKPDGTGDSAKEIAWNIAENKKV